MALPLMTSCFTGVESTPKITLNDVKRENGVQVSPERMLMDSIVPENMPDWKPGKTFLVIDDKARMIFSRPEGGYSNLSKGDVIKYQSRRETTTITGDRGVELYFSDVNGIPSVYRSSNDSTFTAVPFTIDLELVDNARALLSGRHLWTTTPVWRDTMDNVVTGLKFVEVKVTDVNPGTATYPLRVDFETVDAIPALAGSLMIITNRAGAGSRTFEGQFSLTDPYVKYPLISDEHWDIIKHGRLVGGMTRDECRLSIGSPKDIDRRAGYSDVREVWMYENGIYLIFSDGLLIDYRR